MSPGQPLQLTVLGSGTCELRPDASSPAHLVSCGSTHLLLDLGQGALRRLVQSGIAPAKLTAVLISHHHLDHLADLLPLLFALNYDPAMRTANLTICAHPDLQPVLSALQGAFDHWLVPRHPNVSFTWLAPGDQLTLGPIRLRTAAAAHVNTSLAFRLQTADASLVYLGDTEPTGELARLAHRTDLLLANCAATDQNPKPGHLGPRAAGRLAARARARSLVLCHLYRDVDPETARQAAGRVFDGPVWMASDRQVFTIGRGAVTTSP